MPHTRRKPRMNLTAKSIKVSLVLAPAQFAHLVVPVGAGRQPFRIKMEDGPVVSGELNPKSLRKVAATIAEHGVDGVAVIMQGKLGAGDVIIEAGLSAQVKAALKDG